MALLTAANLRKEFLGTPLFDGVSFKVERSDRLALAGVNGSGKTTLLRALAGEISLDGGELAWEKGIRVALHDRRPPALSPQPLGKYVLSGTSHLAALERELRELEQQMVAGAHDQRTMARYARTQERLAPAGGRDASGGEAAPGASAGAPPCAGSGSAMPISSGRSRPSRGESSRAPRSRARS